MAIRQPTPRPLLTTVPARGLTVDDWFALPEDGNQYELYEGVLLLMAAPVRLHQDIVFKLSRRLGDQADLVGGYAGIGPLGVVLSERMGFLADIVYVAAERRTILSDRGIEQAPDIVVEVLSPSTRSFDRNSKLRAYLAAGVREVWLVDPQERVTSIWSSETESATAAFGERIPSRIVEVADGGLGAF